MTATGLEPKPAIAKGMGSGLILVLPRSLFDVVDGQGSLVDGRGEDHDGVRFVAKVVEAGGGIE